MLFSSFSFSETALADFGAQTREFWFQISPPVNETWSDLNIPTSFTTLTISNPSSSFSEIAFSQSSLSDLGFSTKKETWSRVDPENPETWTAVSPVGTEIWATIAPSDNESWVDISTQII